MRALVIVLMLTATVRADAPGDAAILDGTKLAEQGHYEEAIVRFKAARTAAPGRPDPDCLIALAYRRLERWSQARLFLGRCT
jgi:Flp pilus assembly protein TadD